MKAELLVGSGEFWSRLKEDLAAAEHSAYVQTFSFEGDRVGTALGRALERSPAKDRRLQIDAYSLLYHNDRIIPGPAWLDADFRKEVFITHRWKRRLEASGAQAKFGNPISLSPISLVRRNHKKLALVDDRIAYLGGINFSDHNFEWHDMMYRIESPELGKVLGDDFRDSYGGAPSPLDQTIGPIRLIGLSGRGNARSVQPVLDAMAEARTSIDVVSAYLSYPFTAHLGAARERGVRVRVLTPRHNNKANLARHIMQAAHAYDLEVYEYDGGMNHLKAMVIDERQLVAGSSNFDFMSYHILEEIILMTEEVGMVEAFMERVWNPDLEKAEQAKVRSTVATRAGDATVRAYAVLASALAIR